MVLIELFQIIVSFINPIDMAQEEHINWITVQTKSVVPLYIYICLHNCLIIIFNICCFYETIFPFSGIYQLGRIFDFSELFQSEEVIFLL